MKKALCLFDYGPKTMTGFATVSKNIVIELKKAYGNDLHMDIVAINYFDTPYTEYNGTVNVISGKLSQDKKRIQPGSPLEKGDDFGRLVFLDYLQKNDYDIIYVMQDLGVIVPIIELLKNLKELKKVERKTVFKSVFYFPVDGNLPRSMYAGISFFDELATYTEFAKNDIVRNYPELKDRVHVVPHGIDVNEFYPVEDRVSDNFRKHYFGKNSGKVIIGVLNRNQPRKDIPTSIFGFLHAKKIWKYPQRQPFLYLHCNPKDPLGHDLRQVLTLCGLIEDKDYMFPKMNADNNKQVPVEELNLICNSIDMFLTTARGGGWELFVTQCMATKTTCIVPDHTSMGEIADHGERAFVLEEFLPVCNVEDGLIRSMCHHEEVGEVICEIYDQQNVLKGAREKYLIEKSYEWVTKLTWENVCKAWVDIFNKLL